MEVKNISEHLDLQELLTKVISHYETTTGRTISDEIKSIMFDFGERAVLITYGEVLRAISCSAAIPDGSFAPLMEDLLQETWDHFVKSLREARASIPLKP